MIYFAFEPKGETYHALIKFATKRCTEFSLVWHYQGRFKPARDEMLAALEPFFISQKNTNEWPGTRIGGTATVRRYRACRESGLILCRIEGLYRWLHPQYPEDLAFYLASGKTWLSSIAHEKEGWVEDDAAVLARLLESAPNLQVRAQRRARRQK